MKVLYLFTLLNGAINFLTTYILFNFLNAELFGDILYSFSFVSLMSILFSLVPTNYAVIELQENKNFLRIYTLFYIVSAIPYTLLFLVIILWFKLYYLVVFYGFFYGLQSVLDTKMQSEGKLKEFYKLLVILSLIRFLISFFLVRLEFSLELYFFLLGMLYLVTFLFFYLQDNFPRSTDQFRSDILDLFSRYNDFKGYYGSSFLKIINENMFMIVTKNVLSVDMYVKFNIFHKGFLFSHDLLRLPEVYLYNFNNRKSHFNRLFKSIKFSYLISFSITFFVILVYSRIVTGRIDLTSILVFSIGSILFFPFSLHRSSEIVRKSNYIILRMYLFEMICWVIFSLAIYIYNLNDYFIVVVTYISINLMKYIYFIYQSKSISRNTSF